MNNFNIVAFGSDSYKVSHHKLYPPDTQIVYSYCEPRAGARLETRFFGLQYIVSRYLTGNVVTQDKIEEADQICNQHFGRPDVFNREGWEHILRVHKGKLPIKIKALPEGMVVPEGTCLFTIENTDPQVPWLTNYLETILMHMWSPTTVCSSSYALRNMILDYLEKTGDPSTIDFKLHDFGYRGVSSLETAALAGAAHLVNFMGSDTMAAIPLLRDYYGADMPMNSIPACYDDETDILTNNGFRKFSTLNKSDLVAQYNANGTIEFVKPLKIYEYEYSGNLFEFDAPCRAGRVNLRVTPDHRIITKKEEIRVSKAKEVNFKYGEVWIQAGKTMSESKSLSFIDRLKIAFQADGSFSSRKNSYNGKRTGCIPIRFYLKKKRKIKRLDWILENLDWEFSKNKCKTRKGYFSYRIRVPLQYKFSKVFDWIDLSKISCEWCTEFIKECSLWDGSNPTKSTTNYSSSIKRNSDIVQAISVLANRRGTASEYYDKRKNREVQYHVSSTEKQCRGTGQINIREIEYDGKVYCVTVPSGMIVVRRNGTVSISGNSEHSVMTAEGQTGEANVVRRILRAYPDGLIVMVGDSYDMIKFITNVIGKNEDIVDSIKNRNGCVICRPDSGSLPQIDLDVYSALESVFGFDTNSKGYRVLPPYVKIIQGDGIKWYRPLETEHIGNGNVIPVYGEWQHTIQDILDAFSDERISADNIAFGSGGGLLQDFNRDTQRFAIKCSAMRRNGRWFDIYKQPKTDPTKNSKKGRLKVIRETNGTINTINADVFSSEPCYNIDLMQTKFLNGELVNFETFDQIRKTK